MEPSEIHEFAERLRAQVRRVVIGQHGAVDLLLVALLSQGHVLIEGVPGTAKTLLAQVFARTLSLAFGRIQFTPDLMPGDVIGTHVFDFQSGKFRLTRGPIFTDVLLADELNRTPPKTQAALLQAMQERSVTIDGTTHTLGPAFTVLATQNPIEQEGTYPLPEAQLDRFLFKLEMGYPTRDEEREMVRIHGGRTAMPKLDDFGLEPIVDAAFLASARETVSRATLSAEVGDYVVDVVRATRDEPTLSFGASPRSANMLAVAARSIAVLRGRAFVVPDDVKQVAVPLLAHRVVLSPDAQIEGASARVAIERILARVPAPR